MNESQTYAQSLEKRFQVILDMSKLTGNEVTAYEVAKTVLPKDLLIRWLKEESKKSIATRKKFNLHPYNKFTKEIKELIKQTQEN